MLLFPKTDVTHFLMTLSKLQQNVIAHLDIAHGAIWGVLARKGLTLLTTYDGVYLGGVVWANFAACLVIAVFSKYQKSGIVIGVSTGFCGTLSSFSSLMIEAFNYGANVEVGFHYNYPNAAYGIMQVISVILTQLGVSFLGYHIGIHLSFHSKLIAQNQNTLSVISAIAGILLFITSAILLGLVDSWRQWMFSCLFAPFGAILRYHLAKLNSTWPHGTFLANIIGSIVLAVLTLISRSKKSQGLLVTSHIGCEAIQGAGDGFCGGLSTVSTFVGELYKMKVPQKYDYGIKSIVICFTAVLLILGPYNWTRGLVDPVCSNVYVRINN